MVLELALERRLEGLGQKGDFPKHPDTLATCVSPGSRGRGSVNTPGDTILKVG
jgi:hypothetical protein